MLRSCLRRQRGPPSFVSRYSPLKTVSPFEQEIFSTSPPPFPSLFPQSAFIPLSLSWKEKWTNQFVSRVLRMDGYWSLLGAWIGQREKWNASILSQEGGPLPGPETGLLSNTQKWIAWGDTGADKARDFIGKGRPGGEQEGKGTQENCSAAWLTVSGFMVMGLVSGLSLANHSDSESSLVVHALFS